MEAKLAAYRAQKAAERQKTEKRQKVWSLLTFEGKIDVRTGRFIRKKISFALNQKPTLKLVESLQLDNVIAASMVAEGPRSWTWSDCMQG